MGANEEANTLPGTRTSCAVLTVLTVLLAWPNAPVALAATVLPAYFVLLTWFFLRAARACLEVHKPALRLVCAGFAVLGFAFTTAAGIHFGGLESLSPGFAYLREVCEHGALFLLGTTLISFGLMQWIPRMVQSHRQVLERSAQQLGELRIAESTRSELEQRLVEADRRGMLGELAATIAHDLRNPLTIVRGTAESLCRRERTPREIAEHTQVIRRNVEKADQTIAALIDLARPRKEAPTTFLPHELLVEIAELVRVEAERRGIALELPAGDATPDPLCTNRTLLAQALLNLVLNAIQASPDGATVRLRGRATNAGVVFGVDDRGEGLPADVRGGLFTPFFTTKATGTGLGLASCLRIAKELGGEVRLRARRGGGARALLSVASQGPASAPASRREPEEERRCLAPTS
jgi:signal transduction histidine kinase